MEDFLGGNEEDAVLHLFLLARSQLIHQERRESLLVLLTDLKTSTGVKPFTSHSSRCDYDGLASKLPEYSAHKVRALDRYWKQEGCKQTAETYAVDGLWLVGGSVPSVVEDEEVGSTEFGGDAVEEVLLSLGEGRLGVADEDEDVGVEAVAVDPGVELRREIHTRTVHQHQVVLQQTRIRRRPEHLRM